ncbi:hypothetical protein GQ53DRAFT_766414 [Thozetella sp. PMI_491]|nr:hypothetical protein GQ53DRAFT_766414 [Thozetella sp. PMI_491]
MKNALGAVHLAKFTGTYGDASGMMQVYAAGDIQQGEELIDAYSELARLRADGANGLASLGFQCECPVCQGPQTEEHEMRRCRIWRCGRILSLYEATRRTKHGYTGEEIPVFAEIPTTDADALKLADEMAALLEVEGLVE